MRVMIGTIAWSALILMTFVVASSMLKLHFFVDGSRGAMRLLMWHPHQKDVASCLLKLLESERISLDHSASIG